VTHSHNPNYRLQIHNPFETTEKPTIGGNERKREADDSPLGFMGHLPKNPQSQSKNEEDKRSSRNPDEVIEELIKFWNRHQP
jgi:hypothetical protein